MANPEYLEILKQGVEVWNEWREKNGSTRPDLSEADLSELDLRGANLSETNIRRTNLRNANLGPMFHGTGFDVDFTCTDLSDACLGSANLEGTDLGLAVLNGADLSGAHLKRARLNGAELMEANLTAADLGGSDLEAAVLSGANLTGANLSEANLSKIIVGATVFGNIDLSAVKGLDEVEHWGPSVVGIDTIYKSIGNISENFLRGCGVPDNLIAFMHSLTGKAFEFYSCFISHSAKDKRFCERLYADLQAKGVRVWYFPEDAKWGEPVWGEIDRGINKYDKLIVVCSENSLVSSPVNREIERALFREDKEGKGILFPIRIDDYIFEKWEHERKADVVRKVVGDFSGWDKDAAKYDKAFDKLLKGLQAESGKA